MMREVCFLRGCPGPSPHFQFAACAHSAPPRVMVYEHLDVLVSVCRCLSLCPGPEVILVAGGSRLVAGLSTAPAPRRSPWPALGQGWLVAENCLVRLQLLGPLHLGSGSLGLGQWLPDPSISTLLFGLHVAPQSGGAVPLWPGVWQEAEKQGGTVSLPGSL